jgi:ADP-ribose pyrophosphatase YjhB (NUDIX family)
VWRTFRPRTRGVKVMVFNHSGKLLLVRNTYGDTSRFALPGGGVRPWEQPHAAAAREIREEVSVGVTELTLVSTHYSAAEGKRDTVHLFRARTTDDPVPDGFEIAEAAFFALHALPEKLSPATARRIAEHQGDRDVSADW